MEESEWPWFRREIEGQMKEQFSKKHILIHIRGRRRIGKSSTTTRLLRELNRSFYTIFVDQDNNELIRVVNDLLGTSTETLFEMMKAIKCHILKGSIFVLDEIQNSSMNFQSIVQQLADFVDQENPAGGLIIMGSYPKLVEEIVSVNKPLYGRFLHSFTVQPFRISEWKMVMERYGITKPSLLLSLYAMFGGHPSLYKLLVNEGVLNNNTTREKLLNTVCASSMQYIAQDIQMFYAENFGEKLSSVLRALQMDKKSKNCKSQEIQIQERTGLPRPDVLELLKYLEYKLCIISREKPIGGGKERDERYIIVDPLLSLISKISECFVSRDGLNLYLTNSFKEILDKFEGSRLETMVRTIIEERAYKRMSLLPHSFFELDTKHNVKIETGNWRNEKAEIDLICFLDNKILFGSIKRNFTKLCVKNLYDHVMLFLENWKNKLLSENEVVFIYVGTSCTEQEKSKLCSTFNSYESINQNEITFPIHHFCFSLNDILIGL